MVFIEDCAACERGGRVRRVVLTALQRDQSISSNIIIGNRACVREHACECVCTILPALT